MNPDTMARGLGWFSIGLGAVEFLCADSLTEALGMEGLEGTFQLYGAREIATGVGCLGFNPPTGPVWARVAGDVLDIATLAPYMTAHNPKRNHVAVAMAFVFGATLVDVMAGLWLCEGRDGPINSMVRSPVERRERENEQQMRQTEQAGRDDASAVGKGANS